MPDPDWHGPITDGMRRGYPLVHCRLHDGWWTALTPCPACGLARQLAEAERRIAALLREQDQRCAECKLRRTA